jgi:hypothetical protein
MAWSWSAKHQLEQRRLRGRGAPCVVVAERALLQDRLAMQLARQERDALVVGERRGAHELGDRPDAVALREQPQRTRPALAPRGIALARVPARNERRVARVSRGPTTAG